MILLALALLAAPPPSGARGNLALNISAGVSLGSYEAGLTWAIVRYLRASDRGTDLAAVTGASAGAVNALMAAAMWCEERMETRDEHPDTNLFHDLWAPSGSRTCCPTIHPHSPRPTGCSPPLRSSVPSSGCARRFSSRTLCASSLDAPFPSA